MAKYQVKVDKDACTACGSCYALCPDVYEEDDEGKSRIVEKFRKTGDDYSGIIEDDLYTCAKDAADTCPVNAITVEEISE
ncbi:MAG: ferredoxin [Candidatus Odinarchaeia archaeon]